MRELERSVAKGRLKALGVGNVNRKMNIRKNGQPLWRRVLNGDMAKNGLAAQLGAGVKSRRKIRNV